MKRTSILAAAIAVALSATAYADGPVAETGYDGGTTAHDADSSGRNTRDRDGTTLTPLDQSSAPADVELTRNIRKTIVEDDSLGTDARNVKVITVNGNVTLRGPVETANERDRIVSVAKQLAGDAHVTDELEIATR